MQLIQNGESGLLVTSQMLAQLTSLKAIDTAMSDMAHEHYDVTVRDHNHVVKPDDYYFYLQNLRKQAVKTLQTQAAKQSDEKPNDEKPKEKSEAKSEAKSDEKSGEKPDEKPNEKSDEKSDEKPDKQPAQIDESKIELPLRERDELIQRLLLAGKKARNEALELRQQMNQASAPLLAPQLPETSQASNASIKGPLSGLLHKLSGGRKISQLANLAIARGLFGDAQAATLCDDWYGDGTYAEFLAFMKKGRPKDDHNAARKPKSSESDAK